MAGMLYLCATPIGNLEDVTLRVLRILEEVDVIAAEDTRQSIKLLNRYEIKTPLVSYHEHNKIEKTPVLVKRMLSGDSIALVTDAGTPAISDPGEDLVRICYAKGIEVTSLPGAAACVTALTMSGQKTRRFSFEAFLPRDKKQREEVLEEMGKDTRTLIVYEAPHHLKKTLKELYDVLGERSITICRELTKKFEEKLPMTLSEAVNYYEEKEPRGEFVLVIEGKNREEMKKQQQAMWEDLDLEEHMAIYEKKGMARKDAMKAVAKDRGISKREVYQGLL